MTRSTTARLAALALATGTLVAVGASPASAAAPTVERLFDATTSGAVLRVEVNLPAGVPGVLPQQIVQDIALADTAARTGSAATALSNAFIGQGGTVALLQGLLDGKAQASPSKTSDKYSLLEVPANPLGLTGGALTAVSDITSDMKADGVLASSKSSIASLELPAAGALDAVLAPLTDALNAALGATGAVDGPTAGGSPVAPVTTTVEDVLGTVLDTLDEVTTGATTPVSDATRDAVATLTAEINGLLASLNSDLVANLAADDALLDIGLIETAQTVTKQAGTTTSTVTNELAGVSLLGGLISVDGITSKAVASLGDNGASAADAQASLLKANIADVVNLELTDQLEVLLGGAVGEALPADVLGTVNEALATINGLLADTLGLSVVQAAGTERSSADSAEAKVSAATLVLDPLGNAAAPLLRVGFVPAEAKVVAQSITNTPVQVNTPVSLPRTGGEPALAAVATLLVAGALVARRRRAEA